MAALEEAFTLDDHVLFEAEVVSTGLTAEDNQVETDLLFQEGIESLRLQEKQPHDARMSAKPTLSWRYPPDLMIGTKSLVEILLTVQKKVTELEKFRYDLFTKRAWINKMIDERIATSEIVKENQKMKSDLKLLWGIIDTLRTNATNATEKQQQQEEQTNNTPLEQAQPVDTTMTSLGLGGDTLEHLWELVRDLQSEQAQLRDLTRETQEENVEAQMDMQQQIESFDQTLTTHESMRTEIETQLEAMRKEIALAKESQFDYSKLEQSVGYAIRQNTLRLSDKILKVSSVLRENWRKDIIDRGKQQVAVIQAQEAICQDLSNRVVQAEKQIESRSADVDHLFGELDQVKQNTHSTSHLLDSAIQPTLDGLQAQVDAAKERDMTHEASIEQLHKDIGQGNAHTDDQFATATAAMNEHVKTFLALNVERKESTEKVHEEMTQEFAKVNEKFNKVDAHTAKHDRSFKDSYRIAEKNHDEFVAFASNIRDQVGTLDRSLNMKIADQAEDIHSKVHTFRTTTQDSFKKVQQEHLDLTKVVANLGRDSKVATEERAETKESLSTLMTETAKEFLSTNTRIISNENAFKQFEKATLRSFEENKVAHEEMQINISNNLTLIEQFKQQSDATNDEVQRHMNQTDSTLRVVKADLVDRITKEGMRTESLYCSFMEKQEKFGRLMANASIRNLSPAALSKELEKLGHSLAEEGLKMESEIVSIGSNAANQSNVLSDRLRHQMVKDCQFAAELILARVEYDVLGSGLSNAGVVAQDMPAVMHKVQTTKKDEWVQMIYRRIRERSCEKHNEQVLDRRKIFVECLKYILSSALDRRNPYEVITDFERKQQETSSTNQGKEPFFEMMNPGIVGRPTVKTAKSFKRSVTPSSLTAPKSAIAAQHYHRGSVNEFVPLSAPTGTEGGMRPLRVPGGAPYVYRGGFRIPRKSHAASASDLHELAALYQANPSNSDSQLPQASPAKAVSGARVEFDDDLERPLTPVQQVNVAPITCDDPERIQSNIMAFWEDEANQAAEVERKNLTSSLPAIQDDKR